MVWCCVCTEDVERIGRLVNEVNRRATWVHKAKRLEVLRALVRKGLDLVKTGCFAVECLGEEPAEKLCFKLSPDELGRVDSLQKDYVKGLSKVAEPHLASVLRTLIRLGIAEAARGDGVLRFVEEVKSSLWPRSEAPPRGRRAAEAQGAPLREPVESPAPSNDVDDGDRRALAGLGRRLLASALAGSRSQPVGFAPPLEEQPRLRAQIVAEIDALIRDEEASDDAAPVTGPRAALSVAVAPSASAPALPPFETQERA
jgi:hypothetical protein